MQNRRSKRNCSSTSSTLPDTARTCPRSPIGNGHNRLPRENVGAQRKGITFKRCGKDPHSPIWREAVMTPERAKELLQQYGVGPIQFSGTHDALYERHLTFDNVVDVKKATAREQFEAAAR